MGLKKKAVVFTGLCLVFTCGLLSLMAYFGASDGFSKAYIAKVTDDAHHIALVLDAKYPGTWSLNQGKLFKGEQNMEEVSEILDTLAGEDAITLFNKDTRVSTTIKQDGKRAVGTQAGRDVVDKVVSRGENHSTELDVLGVP